MQRNFILLFILINAMFISSSTNAQKNSYYMRIARLTIDSVQLTDYQIALKEAMETAIKIEPGVISFNAVYNKKQLNHITIFETYADEKAYQIHIQTPHFKKYKEKVANMVQTLELIDVNTLAYFSKD